MKSAALLGLLPLVLSESCKPGQDNVSGTCYPKCEENYTADGSVCWETCKADETEHGVYCSKDGVNMREKDVYARNGVAETLERIRERAIITEDPNCGVTGCCKEGEEYDAGLCYTKCKDSYGVGPVCWERCKEGETDDGATCRTYSNKDTYDRGVGRIPDCAPDTDKNGALCYPKCKDGYTGVGPVCWGKCPEGYEDHGATCFKWMELVKMKPSYGRTAGTIPDKCNDEEDLHAAMCYKKCKTGYTGIVTVCYEDCPKGTVDIGLMCTKARAKGTHARGVGTLPIEQ